MTAKKVYIVEQKLSHWTTVEPLIVQFRRRNWNVVVLADKRFEQTAKNYLAVHGHSASDGLVYRDVNKLFSFWPALFSPPNLAVVSDRYFYPKNLAGRKGMSLWLRFFGFFLSRFLFLNFVAKRSTLIRTTHFTDLVNLPEKVMTGLAFVDGGLDWIWKKSIKATLVVHVYSSLVKDKHVLGGEKEILVAPNALYRPPAGYFEVRDYAKPRIVIPGRIDARRRQYDWIEKLPANLSNQIDVVMVGKIQNRSDMRFLTQLQNKGFDQIVTSENSFIPFDEFDAQLYSADFLFVPLRQLDDPRREVDRNLGAFFDAVRYGKGILLPSDVLAPPELDESLVPYRDDEELVSLFQRFSEDKEFLESLKDRALSGARRWTEGQNRFMEQLIKFS